MGNVSMIDEHIDEKGMSVDLLKRKGELINGLIAAQETLQKHLAEKDATIERLQTEKAKLHKIIPKMIKEAKSEAIKEFAERLPKNIPHFDDGYTTMQVVEGAVKHLVEIMTPKTDTSVSLVDGHIENDFDSRAFWEDTH